jgi:hypothetical protein
MWRQTNGQYGPINTLLPFKTCHVHSCGGSIRQTVEGPCQPSSLLHLLSYSTCWLHSIWERVHVWSTSLPYELSLPGGLHNIAIDVAFESFWYRFNFSSSCQMSPLRWGVVV